MKELLKKIIKFRDERGWKKHDTPEALAKSIVIEAAELLENYQWPDTDPDMENVREELADVLMYALAMAADLGMDPEEIILEKLRKNIDKYPL
ncbi:MAG TPA: nucleotide pyrophosphohydrolase [Bacillota bacterium]|nr:nucleotide pyrophosphohydrolase [Bacillota bacterium]HPF42300.1 nucleotide pyrophosphohydrolase [Bacillota bacterium]HPJ86168.1 nucleotide pyrophosphohydrolase [Bacillota bacterium]HPQ61895.1 nucleotide pyrophosphohydrolase [Bacillota bacterium]HRX92323.1 nucleotide pyrophosphohydrolase [Candidatus Izemoplasmatales bacterium]